MTSDRKPLVSIITPVYNGEKYLAECIESVLDQNYDNWEYIIVNNCSTDRTPQIAKEFAKKDSRIRVHENSNFLSMVENFNHALHQISDKSKYCKIVHADDFLFPYCIKEMVALNEKHSSVGIVGAYVLEGLRLKCHGLPRTVSVMSGRDIARLSLLDKSPVKGGLYVFGSPTSLLIRTDIIRSRKNFYSDKYLEVLDQEACYYLLQHVDFGFVHQVLTFSRVHTESSTSMHNLLMRRYPEELMLLKEYGPIFLTMKEYSDRIEQRLDKYYRFLAKNFGENKGRDFWDFHKSKLENLGFKFSLKRVIKNISKRELIRKPLRWLRQSSNNT
jgi:glycosyltransferase involved in cell wall biosynthesis